MNDYVHFPDPPAEIVVTTNDKDLVAPNEIPGNWVYQKCAQPGCDKKLGYWSLSGEHKPEYRGAKCDKHKGDKK